MRVLWAAASFALAACATASMTPFALDELMADPQAYIATRYAEGEMPAALVEDLADADFQCQHSETMSECGRARLAFGNCFDIVTVRISATEPVNILSHRRCTNARR